MYVLRSKYYIEAVKTEPTYVCIFVRPLISIYLQVHNIRLRGIIKRKQTFLSDFLSD